MICIKCGNTFTAFRKEIVCHDCKQEHIKTIAHVDGTSNISMEEAVQLRDKIQQELQAINMLIEGKTLAEISDFMGMSKQKTSLFLSNRTRRALGYYKNPPTNKPNKKIVYVPVWPENLYCAVFDAKEYSEIPLDAEKAIDYILDMLTEREKTVIINRFKDGLTFEEISETFKLTRECIRQIESKALKKMRHPSRSICLKDGYQTTIRNIELEQAARLRIAEQKRIEEEKSLSEVVARHIEQQKKLSEINIDDLDFGARTYNCLKRSAIHTLADLSNYSIEDIGKIKNLGVRSLGEIISKCEKYDVIFKHA